MGCYRFLASSALATVTIALVAVVLAWATWIESRYGTPAVQFGVYQSTWFAVLLAILGANVLAAAAIRFPWRHKQIGFLIVHAGILVLLVGCWISREDSIDARLVLFEGESESRALDDRQQFVLSVQAIDSIGRDSSSKDPVAGPKSQTSGVTAWPAPTIVEIPFESGPFNWGDYTALGWFPWRLAHRDRGILYDRDGIRLEVLDYCSDSRRVAESEPTRNSDSDKPTGNSPPGRRVVPIPFDKDRTFRQQRARVRLTVDGNQREFWLADPFAGEPDERFGGAHGKDRVVMLRLERPTVDLGFQVRLRDFECQYDPGTSRASHYESRVDFLTADKQARALEKDVPIAPNRPARFTDPASGRTFRLFQTSFDGPFVPEQLPERNVGPGEARRDRIYRSDLIVAYDPGRQWKYAGCLMILAGILVMYTMKAYFFRRRHKGVS